MSLSKSRKTGTFDRASVPGGFDEVTPAGVSQVDTDEMNASLKQEQADRQAEERGENEGMLVAMPPLSQVPAKNNDHTPTR